MFWGGILLMEKFISYMSEIWPQYKNIAMVDQNTRNAYFFGRTAEYLEMEKVLYEEYQMLYQHRLKVMGWWSWMRGQQLLQSMSSDSKFKFSDMWFTISVYTVLHTKLELKCSFHQDIRAKAATGIQIYAELHSKFRSNFIIIYIPWERNLSWCQEPDVEVI